MSAPIEVWVESAQGRDLYLLASAVEAERRLHANMTRLAGEHYQVRDKLRDEVIAAERQLAAARAENERLRAERDEAMALAGDFEERDPSTPLTDKYDALVARIASREGR